MSGCSALSREIRGNSEVWDELKGILIQGRGRGGASLQQPKVPRQEHEPGAFTNFLK